MSSNVLTSGSVVRNTALLLVALFIDGLQAAISWSIALIAAFPGSAAGGAAGCAAGQAVAGQIGCWIGGGVLGLLGTTGNALLAPFTIPVGIVLGIAINMTLSFVLGWGLLFTLLLFAGLKPYKRIGWSGVELIPGINNIPCWTFFTISCLWAASKTPAARKGVLGLASLALSPVRGIMNIQEDAGRLLGTTEVAAPQPQSARELVRASEAFVPQSANTRIPIHDIRPAT